MVIPCLEKHLPAVLDHFPIAKLIEIVTSRALAQLSIQKVSVPGYIYDLITSPLNLVNSGTRVTPYLSATAGPVMTCILRKLIPQELWLFGEVAAVTVSEQDTAEPQYMTCILRENLESRANESDESLVPVAALLERPQGCKITCAELLFGLETAEDKLAWFRRFFAYSFSL